MPDTLAGTFARAVTAAGGSVTMAHAATVATTIASVVRGAAEPGVEHPLVMVPPDLEDLVPSLRAEGLRVTIATRTGGAAPPLAASHDLEVALREADAAVTRGLVGVAGSGSVAVGPGGGNGGLLAALSPHHVIILPEEDLRQTLSEAIAEISRRFVELGGEAVFVTGPSRTADIEMMSVLGVHGPLRLDVVIVKGEGGNGSGRIGGGGSGDEGSGGDDDGL